MATNFRRSKKVGPFRITASQNGLGVSAGAGPVRVSRSPKGRVTRTVRAPGAGIYKTKVVNSGGGGGGRGGRIPGEVGPGNGPGPGGASRAGGGGARSGGPGKNDARNGCIGLIVIALLILWAVGSCVGGDGGSSPSKTMPAPLVSEASSNPATSAEESTPEEASSAASGSASEMSTDETTPMESSAASEYTSDTPTPEPSSTEAAPAPLMSTPAAAPSCYPKTNAGNCYHIHEFCRKRDIGSSGVDINGTPMTCVADSKRGRWS